MKKIFQVHSYLLILTNQLRAYISSHLRAEAMRMWSWRLKQVAKAEQMLGAIFCTNVKWSNRGKILEALCGKRMYKDATVCELLDIVCTFYMQYRPQARRVGRPALSIIHSPIHSSGSSIKPATVDKPPQNNSIFKKTLSWKCVRLPLPQWISHPKIIPFLKATLSWKCVWIPQARMDWF